MLFGAHTGRWDGDVFGNEWNERMVVLCDAGDRWSTKDEKENPWEVYTDDGKGNGDFVAHFGTLIEACNYVRQHSDCPCSACT